MRLGIYAVGRLRDGPQKMLVDSYLDHFARTGQALGLGPARVSEITDRRGGGKAAQAALLRRAIPERAALVCLDERGQALSSPRFAQCLADLRDAGHPETACVIGGADGLDPDLCATAHLCLGFGPMVWPHMLVRVMLAEQLYRAATILAGTPYHRE